MSKSNTAAATNNTASANGADTTPKDTGPSGADVAIAVGTTVGAAGTIALAGVSAYPIVKDAANSGPVKKAASAVGNVVKSGASAVGNAVKSGASSVIGGLSNLFGRAEGAVTSAMEDAAEAAWTRLEELGLDGDEVSALAQKIAALGEDVTSAEIVPLIETALEDAGKEAGENAIKVAADAMEVAVKAIV